VVEVEVEVEVEVAVAVEAVEVVEAVVELWRYETWD
jgi:hypothetical protein